MFENGFSVLKDFEKAHDWYTKSAEPGNSIAMCQLAAMHDTGLGMVCADVVQFRIALTAPIRSRTFLVLLSTR